MNSKPLFAAVVALSFAFATGLLYAEKKYIPGVTDTEITIGQTMPYSGPLSGDGTIGKAEAAYFHMINDRGGVNGRRIRLLSLDDGYSPPRTVEQTRKLVEAEEVLLIFSSLGTPTNFAIHAYLNAKKVPQLFAVSGASKFNDPKHFPWTIGWHPSFQTEASIYARYILKHKPGAKIGVLYQDDTLGKEYLKGLREGLGDQAATMIVSEVSYQPTDPTVDSQIITLKGSGADTFVDFSTSKAAAQAIRKAYDIGWRPLHILIQIATSVSAVLTPAGLDKSVGLLSAGYFKDPTDPQWADDAALKDWLAWMTRYYPEGDRTDRQNVQGYTLAQALVQVLKQCGDDLTRENVMKQAGNLKEVGLPMLLPGIKINTSPTDYALFKQLWLQKFDGKQWKVFGELMGR